MEKKISNKAKNCCLSPEVWQVLRQKKTLFVGFKIGVLCFPERIPLGGWRGLCGSLEWGSEGEGGECWEATKVC